MKKIATLILFTFSFAGYSQSLDCNKLKNGKYYAPYYPSSSFVIKDNIMEDYINNELVVAWDLKWLNNCEFEVVCTSSTEALVAVGDKMIVSITSINGNCLDFDRKLLNKKFKDGVDKLSFYTCLEIIK
jgi:hypothetical protein